MSTCSILMCCEDTIFVGVDSRGTAYDTNAFILTEKAKKLFKIQYNIVATIAEDSGQCEALITYVKDIMENAMDINGGVAGDIHRAATLAQEYIRTWKSVFRKPFIGSVLIIGWENGNKSFRRQDKCISAISCTPRIHTNKDCVFAAHQNGIGGHFAFEYYLSHGKGNSREELLELLKHVLLYATIVDPMSGGLICVTEVRPFGFSKIYSHRVLEMFFDHYDAMTKYLPHTLVSLWCNCDHEYTYEHNEKVNGVLFGFLGDYHKSVVLGINRKFVVRLLHFSYQVHAKYEQLKQLNAYWVQDYEMNSRPKSRHTYDCTVHLAVRELPWILMSGFDSPIVFGEPTRNLVKLLRDV
ncbi:unnamed protein product [Prunus armeniaca]|uniref:Uncharacterized protein n=1 Tax=Prunus armeniaca TaxID=36596 RepID=A0A6J5UQY9_PRUAR|nr:unnamed protein product [Prunus armeniaca]